MALSLIGLEQLQRKKNLLAFSAGSDSSALFHMLVNNNIPFDLAIVDYQKRAQSKAEVAYAKELAQHHKKIIFVKRVKLPDANFEAEAKKVRFSFFEEIIKKHGYQNLITAHHLGDLFEWFLMQIAKGAGLVEAVGMEPIEKRSFYTIVRPLLLTPKKEIYDYLHQNNIVFFMDKSNKDIRYRRNYFRAKFSEPFLQEFSQGVQKSFQYLLQDRSILLNRLHINEIEGLLIAKSMPNLYEEKRLLDRMAKRLGYLLSTKQKEEMLRQKQGVVGQKLAFFINEDITMMAPYIQITIPKKFREECRQAAIPKPLRGYLFVNGINPQQIREHTFEE